MNWKQVMLPSYIAISLIISGSSVLENVQLGALDWTFLLELWPRRWSRWISGFSPAGFIAFLPRWALPPIITAVFGSLL